MNAVCLGIIDTPTVPRFNRSTPEGCEGVIAQEPVGQMGKPAEIACRVAVFGHVPFVVGHAMVIDGGQTV